MDKTVELKMNNKILNKIKGYKYDWSLIGFMIFVLILLLILVFGK